MTEAERSKHPCYIARHSCGGVVMMAVKPDANDKVWTRDVAKEVAACIRKGYAVETVTVEQARASTMCECWADKPERAGRKAARRGNR